MSNRNRGIQNKDNAGQSEFGAIGNGTIRGNRHSMGAITSNCGGLGHSPPVYLLVPILI